MGIGKRIKEARERLGITQNELAEMVGVTGSAITNYEKETSHPKESIMYKLFDALQVDANYLFQDVVNIPKKVNDITFSEYDHIKKYRSLDPYGQETVSYILDREVQRVRQINDLSDQFNLSSEMNEAENTDIKEQPSLSTGDLDALSLGRTSNQQTKRKA